MPGSSGTHRPLLGAIDQGTSSGRFLVFNAKTFEKVASHQIPISLIYPKEGWVEQDPYAILELVQDCLLYGVDKLTKDGYLASDICAIGVTNQRESVVAWDKSTGKALYNVIVWQDMRTTNMLKELVDTLPSQNKNHFKSTTGLPLSPYFSASKIRWLLENVDEVREANEHGRLVVGTVDSWIIWNLTGGPAGGVHATDVSNASRTSLMNLHTLKWDATLCKFFRVPQCILPDIRSSSEIYGRIAGGKLAGVPIAGVLGDQQAALVGQMCFEPGQAKNTYGTGCFLLYNTGHEPVDSKCGLVTTVAYQLGPEERPTYALEGSVAVAGAAFNWLRDNVDLLTDISQSEALAHRVNNTGDVYFVPAFSGLYAPYWQADARGVICGISETTSRSHIIRAALEAVCFQARDILDAMVKDCGMPFRQLKVDGGMTANNLLMQLQADLAGITVVRPDMAETTSLGAALVAGLARGVQVLDMKNLVNFPNSTMSPQISEQERNERYSKWKMAVERSLGWDTLFPL